MNKTNEFVISRLFDAPRVQVWAAWTQPELFGRWFGPAGVTTTILSADIRPGGHVHCRMDFPDGGGLWAKLVYRTVEPPHRLVWEHSFSDADGAIAVSPFSNHWPLILLNSVTLEEEGDTTRMRLVSVPLDATAQQDAEFRDAFDDMRGGWGGNFDVLDVFLDRP